MNKLALSFVCHGLLLFFVSCQQAAFDTPSCRLAETKQLLSDIPIFYINMDSAESRKERYLRQFGCLNVTRIAGVDMSGANAIRRYLVQGLNHVPGIAETHKDEPEWDGKTRRPRHESDETFYGALGCTVSHLLAAEAVVRANIPYAIVMEDDMTDELLSYWHENSLRNLIQRLPTKWSAVQLSILSSEVHANELYNDRVNRTTRTIDPHVGMHTNHSYRYPQYLIEGKWLASNGAYLLSLEGAKQLLRINRNPLTFRFDLKNLRCLNADICLTTGLHLRYSALPSLFLHVSQDTASPMDSAIVSANNAKDRLFQMFIVASSRRLTFNWIIERQWDANVNKSEAQLMNMDTLSLDGSVHQLSSSSTQTIGSFPALSSKWGIYSTSGSAEVEQLVLFGQLLHPGLTGPSQRPNEQSAPAVAELNNVRDSWVDLVGDVPVFCITDKLDNSRLGAPDGNDTIHPVDTALVLGDTKLFVVPVDREDKYATFTNDSSGSMNILSTHLRAAAGLLLTNQPYGLVFDESRVNIPELMEHVGKQKLHLASKPFLRSVVELMIKTDPNFPPSVVDLAVNCPAGVDSAICRQEIKQISVNKHFPQYIEVFNAPEKADAMAGADAKGEWKRRKKKQGKKSNNNRHSSGKKRPKKKTTEKVDKIQEAPVSYGVLRNYGGPLVKHLVNRSNGVDDRSAKVSAMYILTRRGALELMRLWVDLPSGNFTHPLDAVNSHKGQWNSQSAVSKQHPDKQSDILDVIESTFGKETESIARRENKKVVTQHHSHVADHPVPFDHDPSIFVLSRCLMLGDCQDQEDVVGRPTTSRIGMQDFYNDHYSKHQNYILSPEDGYMVHHKLHPPLALFN